jgi:hypothetical protein
MTYGTMLLVFEKHQNHSLTGLLVCDAVYSADNDVSEEPVASIFRVKVIGVRWQNVIPAGYKEGLSRYRD